MMLILSIRSEIIFQDFFSYKSTIYRNIKVERGEKFSLKPKSLKSHEITKLETNIFYN